MEVPNLPNSVTRCKAAAVDLREGEDQDWSCDREGRAERGSGAGKREATGTFPEKEEGTHLSYSRISGLDGRESGSVLRPDQGSHTFSVMGHKANILDFAGHVVCAANHSTLPS